MDNSRLFLFAGLIFVGMLLWQQWNIDYGPQSQPPFVQSTDPTGSGVSNLESTDDLPDFNEDVIESASAGTIGTVNTGSVPTRPQSRIVTVDTDVVQARIDTHGGVIRSLKLKQYPTSLEQPDDWLELIHNEHDTLYFLESGLRNKQNTAPTHLNLYRAEQTEYLLADDAEELVVPFYWSENGIEVIKRYRFPRGDYLIQVSHEIINNSAEDWRVNEYRQITRSRPLEESRLLYTYTGSVYYNDIDKYEKVDFDDMEDEKLKVDQQGGWIAMIQHYFLSAWIPDQESRNVVYSRAKIKSTPSTYTIGMSSKSQVIAPGDSGEFSSGLFVGPKKVSRLEEIAPDLDLTVDYGVLTFLSKPLYWLLSWFHSYVGNWGVAIILLTFTIKAVFYKLSETSYRSMAKMRKVSPRLKTLKERYGTDRQKMNQEMMKLYKEEKINPMSGCLPILVQIPVFIALYWALLESVDLRQAPFVLWIEDLSVRDPIFVLPILMGISMVVQQRLNPPPPDPIQAKVMQALPYVFSVFFAFFPAGLVLYWVVNNVLSIIQQYVITKRIESGESK